MLENLLIRIHKFSGMESDLGRKTFDPKKYHLPQGESLRQLSIMWQVGGAVEAGLGCTRSEGRGRRFLPLHHLKPLSHRNCRILAGKF